MNGTNHANTITDQQAWRRRPRTFHSKSRLGCKTCKIRRVKCDLSRPSCSRCQSTGRACDGYPEETLSMADSGPDHVPIREPGTLTQVRQMTGIGPFMVLPWAGSAPADAMCFFEHLSIKDMNQYQPSDSWRNTIMFLSQTAPAVRHAAVALASVHRNYAIQLVLKDDADDSTRTTAVTLMVCYLFTCFEHLAGDYVQAMKHLRGGVELSRSIEKTIQDDGTVKQASQTCAVISQIRKQIRRLDMQAATFLVDWTPADFHSTPLTSQVIPSGHGFSSLSQAADHLQTLVARVMRLRNAEQQAFLVGEVLPPPPSALKGIIVKQLNTWSRLFEDMLLLQDHSPASDHSDQRLTSLLRLHHIIAWTLLASYGPGREMAYDAYLPRFQQCVALAQSVLATVSDMSTSSRSSQRQQPTFTPEIGILPVLYVIGAKCREPSVRRAVLDMLRPQRIREAVWDSAVVVRVVERVMEIEENGEVVQSMGQIPVWRRVEAVTWVHVVDAVPARVDVSYTFCNLDGLHSESLVL